MKNLAVAIIFAGLFAGVASAAEPQQPECQKECLCSSKVQKAQKDGKVFKPLFPEYETESRIEG